MFELVFLACLSTNPSHCKDFQLTYMGNPPLPTQCMRFGQPELAKWNAGNPNWHIKKFKCGRVKRDKKAI